MDREAAGSSIQALKESLGRDSLQYDGHSEMWSQPQSATRC